MSDASPFAELTRLFPSLERLPSLLAARLLSACVPREIAAGTCVFDDDTAEHAFPLVLEGTIRVAKRGANGREVLLYRVAPGECCVMSASCLVAQSNCSATGTAESDVRLIPLGVDLFDDIIAAHRPFRQFVFGLFGERLTMLTAMVEAVAFRTLDQRLAALLIALGGDVRITQQRLADQLGSVREVIGRVLRDFEQRGLVELGREHVRVLDAHALSSAAGSAERPR